MNPKIFIVLPVFNRLAFTKKCLASIYSQTYRNCQLILIDDGSTDGTSDFIKKNYPKTKIIKGDGNWWWTKSMYMGVSYALKTAKRTDFILEMNNDLYFDKGYFNELINCAKRHKKALIGSMCVHAQKPTEVVESGVRIDWATGLVYGVAQTISSKISYYKNMDVVGNLDALPGKGTLIPIDVFNKGVNFKYKLLPHYIADYEFAINAKNHGFDLLVCTKAIARHFWEATGLSAKATETRKSYIRAFQILFGRKSMNNIIDLLRFVYLSCPKEYKLRNYYFTFLKLIKHGLTIFPFYYIVPIFPILSKVRHFIHVKAYIIHLKITQFPEYHLRKK